MINQSQAKHCCWVGVTAIRDFLTAHRNYRATYLDLYRFFSRAYYGASIIFNSYEVLIIIEIAWWVQPLTNMSTRDMFTWNYVTQGVKCSRFSFSSWMIHICLLPVIGSAYYPSHPIYHRNQFHLYHLGSAMIRQCYFPYHHLDLVEDVWWGSTW